MTMQAGHDEQQESATSSSNPVVRFFRLLGPGLVTGAADDDPSGIATYSQAGAQYGTSLLWTVPVSLPLMMATQEICDRMALATGDSLGKLIRVRFTRGARAAIGILVVALIVANVLNLAADLMAIGQGMQLLHAGDASWWSAIAGVGIAVAVVVGSFEWIARIFKWLCLVLLVYVGVLFATHVDWASVLAGLVGIGASPTAAYFGLAVAVLGTTISPYMFFWQTAQRVEERRGEGSDDEAEPLRDETGPAPARRLTRGRIDVFTGMVFSVLIMFAIIVATAATLGAHHQEVNTAADAARALEPIAGTLASVLFAIGFIGSGVLTVPVLAASGAAGLAGLLDKPWGLDRSPRRAPLFYVLLTVGIVGGVVLSELVDNPMQILVLSAVVNGIAAGPFLVIMMLISHDRRIMGRYRNRGLAQFGGWAATIVMCVAGAYGIWFTIWGG